MANIFRLSPGMSEEDSNRIRKELRDRVDGCFTGLCWNLKDGDNGQLYLDKKVIDGHGRGRFVQIRRYLFLTTWHTLPDRRKLIPYCKNSRCVNPSHIYYKGFQQPYHLVTVVINAGWITEKQTKDWYGK